MMLSLFARRELTADDVAIKYLSATELKQKRHMDVVVYEDSMCRTPKARWSWYQSSKPTRRNHTIMLNCYRWRLVWLEDLPAEGLAHNDLGLIHHALGLSDPYRTAPPYRNHFVAGEGHSDNEGLARLVAAGLMTRRSHPLSGGDFLYTVTDKGINLGMKTRPAISSKKRRYRRFLSLLDCCPELTFREFLTSPEFASYR